MPDLSFQIEGVAPLRFGESPTLVFKLRITNAQPDELIQSVLLRCQIRIEVRRRSYHPAEQERLFELFGRPEQWKQSLQSLVWMQSTLLVTEFTGSTCVDLPAPCTFDFNVSATKYFAALEEGYIPVSVLFSGTIFHVNTAGLLQVAPIPWEKEASYRLPVETWKSLMDAYYSDSAWLCLRREAFDRLCRFKMKNGYPTWEQTLESLLERAE